MKRVLWLLTVLVLLFSSCACPSTPSGERLPSGTVDAGTTEEFVVPEYTGAYYVAVGDGVPAFEKLLTESYESYPPLDSLGRCGAAHACLGRELMPTEDRESIGMVKPSGWQTAKYDFVDGKYLYNRCHLIGFQLAGENANERNLITGTRSMNVKGMLPFENMVADYVKETDNHVMYRVTPVFVENELVARGVRMEAYSVEDEGDGICFDVFVFNAEPGVEIDYATGENRRAEALPSQGSPEEGSYVLNLVGKKIHKPDCASAKSIKEENRQEYRGDPEELLRLGYSFCGNCH